MSKNFKENGQRNKSVFKAWIRNNYNFRNYELLAFKAEKLRFQPHNKLS
jgi:hypothetical protein